MAQGFDFIIVGGGMAGASVAAELAVDARVLVLEGESQPGYHATGRSAAAFIPSYCADIEPLVKLTQASKDFLVSDGNGNSETPLLHRRGLLTLFDDKPSVEAEAVFDLLKSRLASPLDRVSPEQIRALLPLLRADWSEYGWYEPEVFDIDVHGLHQLYLKRLKAAGGTLVCNAVVHAAGYEHGCWTLTTATDTYQAPVIINAAGAWADGLAALCGVKPLGLTPLRRTAVLIRPPVDVGTESWPLVLAYDGSFYFKPDAGLILASPADEHPSEACDAQPEEIDVAYAVHFAEQALSLEVSKVEHRWAGLRTFASDRIPVIGFDVESTGFFWLAGQGGHGIQIAPATARLAAALASGNSVPEDLVASGFDPHSVSPGRFQTTEPESKSAHG